MNTPTHMLVTGRVARLIRPGTATTAALGAGFPDLPYLLKAVALAFRGRLTATALDYGRETTWLPDLATHSLLPPAALLAATRDPRARAFALGWLGHVLTDLPVHHTDARPPLWPVSSRRWHAPLSGSERAHHAAPVLTAEAILCAWALAPLLLARRPTMLGAFLRHPARVGEILPTSRYTSAMMARAGSPDGLIVELGAGTGRITGEILRHAAPGSRVVAFEVDERLRMELCRRYAGDPRVTIRGDAARMLTHLNGQRPSVVISALPLTSMSRELRSRVLAQVAESLAPGGMLVQIQYSAVRENDLRAYFGEVSRLRSWRNVPPAWLYLCGDPRVPS